MQLDNTFLIVVLSLLLVIAPFLSKALRLPITVAEILEGIAIGSFLPNSELFSIVAEVGFLYLMFLAGLEVDLKHLAKLPKSLIKKGYVYHFLIYVLSALIVFALGLSNFFMLVLPLISIGIMITLTKEYDKNTPWLDFSIQLGIMGEVISIIALTFAVGVLKFGYSLEFVKIMLTLLMVLIVSVLTFKTFKILFWWFPEIKMWLMPYSDNNYQDIRFSFAFFFIITAIMMILDLELVLGAFMAGIIIGSFFEHKKELPEKLSFFGFGLLVPLFFIHIGATIKFKMLFADGLWGIVFLFILLSVFIRFVSGLVFIKDFSLREILLFSLSQSMPLTLVIAAASVAYSVKTIDEFYYIALVVASVVGVILNSFFIKILSIKSKNKGKKENV